MQWGPSSTHDDDPGKRQPSSSIFAFATTPIEGTSNAAPAKPFGAPAWPQPSAGSATERKQDSAPFRGTSPSFGGAGQSTPWAPQQSAPPASGSAFSGGFGLRNSKDATFPSSAVGTSSTQANAQHSVKSAADFASPLDFAKAVRTLLSFVQTVGTRNEIIFEAQRLHVALPHLFRRGGAAWLLAAEVGFPPMFAVESKGSCSGRCRFTLQWSYQDS